MINVPVPEFHEMQDDLNKLMKSIDALSQYLGLPTLKTLPLHKVDHLLILEGVFFLRFSSERIMLHAFSL